MRVKDKLKKLEVRPSKSLGQNFTIDPSVIDGILQFGRPQAGERLLEIGPGLGALTSSLVESGDLTVIEIEARFCRDLKGRYPKLNIVQADIREVDLGRYGPELAVFGNLPYAFSTEIIFHLLRHANSIRRAVLLLQKEFARRLAAQPGGREFGAITVACQLWCDVRLGPVFSGESFHPPARVDSQVLELRFLSGPRYEVKDPAWLERVVRAAFSQRRKKLINSLRASNIAPTERIEAGLRAAGLDPGARAETVSVKGYVELAEALARPPGAPQLE